MWDNFTIGKNFRNAAGRCVDMPTAHQIYHNLSEYWIDECVLSLSGKVSKNTREGKMITKYIAEINSGKKSHLKLAQYLDKIALRKTHPRIIENQVEALKVRYFARGKESMVENFRKLLEIY